MSGAERGQQRRRHPKPADEQDQCDFPPPVGGTYAYPGEEPSGPADPRAGSGCQEPRRPRDVRPPESGAVDAGRSCRWTSRTPVCRSPSESLRPRRRMVQGIRQRQTTSSPRRNPRSRSLPSRAAPPPRTRRSTGRPRRPASIAPRPRDARGRCRWRVVTCRRCLRARRGPGWRWSDP